MPVAGFGEMDGSIMSDEGSMSSEGKNLHSFVEGFTPSEEADRITCSLSIHKESWGDDPDSHQIQFSQMMETVGIDVYTRKKVAVTSEWAKIDTMWIDNPGLIIIGNTGTRYRINPTAEQRVADALKIVELLVCEGAVPIVIRPGRFFMGEILDVSEASLRVVGADNALVRVIVYPK